MTQATPHQRDLAGESWNPGQYLKFADHRLRPALDLMGRIPLEHPKVVYDLGCGSGNVTRLLADRWPDADVVGMDNSPEMLERAASGDSDTDVGRVRWQTGDLAGWTPDSAPSVLYSNAVIQWVPDHAELVPRLWDLLPSGGCLAVQAPLSWDMRSHHLMRETLENCGPGDNPVGSAELRQAVGNRWVQDPDFYYDLLAPDAAHLDVWTTEYQHVLSGDDAVLEWVTGTGLRPILNGLADGEREIYLEEYRGRLNAEYPKRADGVTLYPFRRLFFVAVRG
jgi:trans-aconitate 2-methyltransferase